MKHLTVAFTIALAGCSSGPAPYIDPLPPSAGPGAPFPARVTRGGALITVHEDAQGWRSMNPPADRARVLVPGTRPGEAYLR